MMQQQAALVAAAQGAYINPMTALAAAQMQQVGVLNGITSPTIPTSGNVSNFGFGFTFVLTFL